MDSGENPAFRARRAAVHSPAKKPMASKIPYQCTGKLPIWNAMLFTSIQYRSTARCYKALSSGIHTLSPKPKASDSPVRELRAPSPRGEGKGEGDLRVGFSSIAVVDREIHKIREP